MMNPVRKQLLLCNIILLILLLVFADISISVGSEETDLLDKLFKNYNPSVRPVLTWNKSLQLNISLHVSKLKELDTKFQFIGILGWIDTYWTDERLKWDPREYGGIDHIVVHPSKMWLPTFILFNRDADYIYDESWYKSFKAVINSDGSVMWSPGGYLKADCEIDVLLFPFDDQICYFVFINWFYPAKDVNLSYTENAEKEILNLYRDTNGQWEIINVRVARQDYFYGSKPYPEVIFGLHLKRKPLFYIMNVILPSLLLAVLVILMCKLPPESGERMSMGVTLLLAFSVFIYTIHDHIPVTSSSVPILSLYLIGFMFVTTLGICENILVLYCYYHDGQTKVPYCFERFCKYRAVKHTKKSCMSSGPNEHVGDVPINILGRDVNFCDEKNNNRKDADNVEGRQKEWKCLAQCIDKCFLCFSVILFTLVIILLLVIVQYSYGRKEFQDKVALSL